MKAVIDDIFVMKCLCRDDCIYCDFKGHFIEKHCPQCGHPEAKMLNPIKTENAKKEKEAENS